MAAATKAFLLLLLISTTVFASIAVNEPNADTEAEIQALLSIRQSLHDPLGSLAGWDPSTPSAPCDWRGVGCLNRRVSELRLPNLRLGGAISPQIANLRLLQKLNLRSNELNGTVPRELFRCTLLHSVFLQYNALSGSLPAEISNLTSLVFLSLAGNSISGEIPRILPVNLRVFDLSSNNLSGEIPSTIASGRSLQVVNLAYNALTGEIPASFGQLLGLEYLYLGYNQLNGVLPSALANCTSLAGFSVEGNEINGVVPASLLCTVHNLPSMRVLKLGFNNFTEIGAVKGCLSALEVLDVKANQINGEFPFFLSNITTLREIDLSGNLLTGVLPSEIWKMQGLQVLKLANNSFTGSVPNELSKCRNLTVLDLEGNSFFGLIEEFVIGLINLKAMNLGMNNFSGSFGSSSLYNLSSLESLSLRGNELAGNFPEALLVLSNLSSLDLSGNKFNGTIPTGIGNLKLLMVLNLSRNGFSGSIPDSIGSLVKLTVLDLGKQNFSGTLPSNLAGLPSLQVIALQENKFSGEVPEGLSSLSGLSYLNLSLNSFSGHIPPTFGFLKSLVALSLSNNNISGYIPPVLGNCSSLQVLDLRSNSLSGDIPVDFSRLSRLTTLDLGRNNLSGQIPSEISNCSSLASLFLDSNHLTGQIPPNLTLLPRLGHFNVSHNDLDGEIPRALGSKFNNQSSFEGNNDLCGKPLHNKCSSDDGNAKNRLIMFVAISASGILLLLSCCCFYTYTFLKWRERIRKPASPKKKHSPSRASGGGVRRSSENGAPRLVMFNDRITVAETVEATRHFEEENVLARTRHGVVFKACYNDGMVLAILRLRNGSLDAGTFRKEVESLGRVKHRNLTVLRGYYAGPGDVTRFLVYDYMPNGNLATLLQEASHQDGHVLNWPMRHLIALGIARGLAFLHVSSMVHGDVRPQNVLFDADFEAHLSDFGLDKFTRRASSEPSTSASVGYASPEAVVTGRVTRESDVYSFGIVLLELLTGKRPVMFGEDEDIVKWVKRQLQTGRVAELLEPGLMELDPESSEWEEFLLGMKVGLLCTAPDPMDRPAMADVVFMLEGCRVGPDVSSSADPTALHSPAAE